MKWLIPIAALVAAAVAHTAPRKRTPKSVVFVIDRAQPQAEPTRQIVLENLKQVRAGDPVAIIIVNGESVAALREALAMVAGDNQRRPHVIVISDALQRDYATYHLADDFAAAHAQIDVIGLPGIDQRMHGALTGKGAGRSWTVDSDEALRVVVRTALTQDGL
jgi:hypothetical protein